MWIIRRQLTKWWKRILIATVAVCCTILHYKYMVARLTEDGKTWNRYVDNKISVGKTTRPTYIPMIEHKCVDQSCLSLLSTIEFTAYKACESEVQNITNVSSAHIKPLCTFMNGTGRKVVALVSETGSGNTWVRGLLEKVTGICTGAIYCDPSLRNTGMIGELVVGPSVLVVKTHTPDYQWEGIPHPDRHSDPHHTDGYYGSAILLVRNPFDAFVSEWNRFATIQKLESLKAKSGSVRGLPDESHTYSLGKDMFGSNRDWNRFLLLMCNRWYNLYTRWFASAVENNVPILVVRYEDIKQNKVLEIEKMLKFLRFEVSHYVVMDKLHDDFEVFHRSHSDMFEHYTEVQQKKVNNIILKADRFLKSYDRKNLFLLREYLRT